MPFNREDLIGLVTRLAHHGGFHDIATIDLYDKWNANKKVQYITQEGELRDGPATSNFPLVTEEPAN